MKTFWTVYRVAVQLILYPLAVLVMHAPRPVVVVASVVMNAILDGAHPRFLRRFSSYREAMQEHMADNW